MYDLAERQAYDSLHDRLELIAGHSIHTLDPPLKLAREDLFPDDGRERREVIIAHWQVEGARERGLMRS